MFKMKGYAIVYGSKKNKNVVTYKTSSELMKGNARAMVEAVGGVGAAGTVTDTDRETGLVTGFKVTKGRVVAISYE